MLGELPILAGRLNNKLLDARVDNINFLGLLELLIHWRVLWEFVSEHFHEVKLGLLLEFLGHSSGRDMIQILEPLHVGNGQATDVGEHVWDNCDPFLFQKLISAKGGWSSGQLYNDLAFEVFNVVKVKSAELGARSKDMALLFHDLLGVGKLNFFNIIKVLDRTRLQLLKLEIVWINTVRIEDGTVLLDNANDFGSLFVHELGKHVPNIAKSLNDDLLTLETSAGVDGVTEFVIVE